MLGNLDVMMWSANGKRDGSKPRQFSADELLNVERGLSSNISTEVRKDSCISIQLENRSIDLEADCKDTRDLWIAALKWLIQKRRH